MFQVLLLLGLLIRLILVPLPGFKADVAFWKGWGLAAADKGVLWMMTNTNYNYPPGFAYVLWLVNKIYAMFADSHEISSYWADNNVLYLFLLKVVTIIADLLVVWVIIKIGRVILNGVKRSEGSGERSEGKNVSPDSSSRPSVGTQNDKKKEAQNNKWLKTLALFYFLNPAVIFDGVVWGQVDQFGLAFLSASCYLLLINRPKWATAALIVGCLMKFQNIIFIPLFFLYIFKQYSIKGLASSLATGFLTFIIVIFPFLLTKQIDRLVWLLTVNSDWFPWYSLNAFNGWWIASGLKGMSVNDKQLVFGITSAKQLGLYLFVFAYFTGFITVFFSTKKNLFRNFIVACALAVFAFFHLLTQSHERYLFPVMGLLPILFIYKIKPETLNPKSETNSNVQKFRISFKNILLTFLIFYSLISVTFFTNMYLSMGWNYPDQVIPHFTSKQTLGWSWRIAVGQILLFGVFIVWVFRRMRQMRLMRLMGVMGVLLAGVLLWQNSPYYRGKPVSLTSLKPIGFRQDYLTPQINKSVESGRGVKFWNRLSVNYYFYDKGIGSHADSEITYHLDRKFSRFSTDYGIDTESDQSARVYFSLIGDSRELFKSEAKGRFDQPGTTTVDVKGVNYLTLRITRSGESNFGAHTDWLDPKLVR